jgi:hypothetical protein
MKIETIELFGFASAFEALRLPFKGKDKSDTDSVTDVYITQDEDGRTTISLPNVTTIGLKDLKLVQRLIKNGDEHAKVMRGINVIASIKAARYFWVELDTYRIGSERLSSESTMHVEGKGLSGKELQKVKAELKEGHVQERIQMFSYQTLRRIYFQRKGHRLPEWQEFREWIESLPMARELITIEKD